MQPPRGYFYGYRIGRPEYLHLVSSAPFENTALCGVRLHTEGFRDEIKYAEGLRFCKKCLKLCPGERTA